MNCSRYKPARRIKRSAKIKNIPGRVACGSIGGGEGRVINLLDGLGGSSCVGTERGCCGIVSTSGSSAQKKGDATFVPSNNRDVSSNLSSEKVVCVVTSPRGDSVGMSLQCTA